MPFFKTLSTRISTTLAFASRYVISLGIVAMIFPNTIAMAFILPIRIADAIFRPSASPEDQDFVFDRVIAILTSAPYADFILALAVWVALARVLELLIPMLGKTDSRSVVEWYKGLKPAERRKLSFWSVLTLGSYLSIAAMVAIPWLRMTTMEVNLTREDLEQQIKAAIIAEQDLMRRFPITSGDETDPFFKVADSAGKFISRYLDESHYTDDTLRAQDSAQLITIITEPLHKLQSHRQRFLSRWTEMSRGMVRLQEDLLRNALSTFETNMQSQMSPQERVDYFNTLSQWCRSNVGQQIFNLDLFFNKYRSFDEIWWRWGNNLRALGGDTLKIDRRSAIPRPALIALKLRARINTLSPSEMEEMRSALVTLSAAEGGMTIVPNPPEPGAGWGPFGLLSRWLLKTRSLPIVLITGMIGFGLLGSTIAAFVRQEEKKRDADANVADDLQEGSTNLIIRGLSAAIVVFLAVEGGIAVFTSGDHEPNPYVLFFTCLVGAVFSDHVWRWAQKRFNEILPGKEENAEDAGSGESGDGENDAERTADDARTNT